MAMQVELVGGPGWHEIAGIALSASTALIVTYIAIRQYLLDKRRLKLDYRDHRMTLFEETRSFVSGILANGSIDEDALRSFNMASADVRLLFGHDILKLNNEIFRMALDMRMYQKLMKASKEKAEHDHYVDKDHECMTWFADLDLDSAFKKYVELKGD